MKTHSEEPTGVWLSSHKKEADLPTNLPAHPLMCGLCEHSRLPTTGPIVVRCLLRGDLLCERGLIAPNI